MKTMYLTVGVSGSGKTTWVDELIKTAQGTGENIVRIERDEIRSTFDDYNPHKISKRIEKRTTEVALKIFEMAVKNNLSVVIADTNLNESIRNEWIKRGKDNGYHIVIKTFSTTLEECIKRDKERAISVGMSVIMRQWKMYVKYMNMHTYKQNVNLPNCIIVDIDGTVADMGDRKPFDWSMVGNDSPREIIISLVEKLAKIKKVNKVIFMSGRDSICREETLTWIKENIDCNHFDLYMRPEGDFRKDTVVKEELYLNNVAGKFNVKAVFDDRPSVVRMWHSLNLPNVICVGNPFIEF